MCGRFANHVQDMRNWVSLLRGWPAGVDTGFNIAPTQQVPVVTLTGCESMRWGLIPAWSKTSTLRFATFNARLESVAEKPAFRNAWQREQTCLVPMLGYYEWLAAGAKKTPYFVTSVTGDPLVAAGLWEARAEMNSFTVLTEPARGDLQSLHPRMPVLLTVDAADAWLRGQLTPRAEASLRYFRVSDAVNNPRHQGETLTQPEQED